MKRRLYLVLAVGLLVIGALADRVFNATTSPTGPVSAAGSPKATVAVPSASSIDQATEHAYAVARQSIVYILNKGVGSGSGIIYDSNGDIVTNDHVISGSTSLSVTLNNGKVYNATIVGTDAADDLAVIHINAPNLTPAKFAAAGSYQPGQTVLAIGSPLGLRQSVTSGLISGLHRVEQEPNGSYISDAVQTSAAINPGNSGGALFTLSDVVVGMPTLEQTSSTSGSTTQDIGFAIPSERIVFIANQIVASGKVQHTGRAYLGLAPTDNTGQSYAFGFGPSQATPSVSGALVARITSSGPAGKAGVQQGDVITGINGTPVTDTNDLLTVLATKKPGQTVTLKVNRNGQSLTFQVKLGELPA